MNIQRDRHAPTDGLRNIHGWWSDFVTGELFPCMLCIAEWVLPLVLFWSYQTITEVVATDTAKKNSIYEKLWITKDVKYITKDIRCIMRVSWNSIICLVTDLSPRKCFPVPCECQGHKPSKVTVRALQQEQGIFSDEKKIYYKAFKN